MAIAPGTGPPMTSCFKKLLHEQLFVENIFTFFVGKRVEDFSTGRRFSVPDLNLGTFWPQNLNYNQAPEL